MIEILSLLTVALLFGGMTLFAFGFAAFVFTALPAATAGPLIRRAFPIFHLLVMATATLAAALLAPRDPLGAGLMAAVALSTLPNRQILTPAINAAADAGEKRRFGRLHGLSVAITLAHIALAAWTLARFV